MRVGVLALQGDFAEHLAVLGRLGVETRAVRLPGELAGLDGLILPGGESTTIGQLAARWGLIEPLREFGQTHAVWGTCAGAILLAQAVGGEPPWLGLMSLQIARNAFGRQRASFETDLPVEELGAAPFPGVFIRAPLIERVWGEARALACLPDGRVVAARQGKLLATAFHPELTGDDRFHRYFLEMVEEN
jgi:5'-phosphate synthase pdxT subunit